MRSLIFLLAISILVNAQRYPTEDLDFYKLEGVWYQIASIPQKWENNCRCTTFQFQAPLNSQLGVTAACRLGSPNGPEKTMSGKFRYVITPRGNIPGKYEFEFG